MIEDMILIQRAARALLNTTDWEYNSLEAQHPVEDWALDALLYALDGNGAAAEAILNKYENEWWEVRKRYKVDWRVNG